MNYFFLSHHTKLHHVIFLFFFFFFYFYEFEWSSNMYEFCMKQLVLSLVLGLGLKIPFSLCERQHFPCSLSSRSGPLAAQLTTAAFGSSLRAHSGHMLPPVCNPSVIQCFQIFLLDIAFVIILSMCAFKWVHHRPIMWFDRKLLMFVAPQICQWKSINKVMNKLYDRTHSRENEIQA